MDCVQMRRLALAGGDLTSPEAKAHLHECAPCRALFVDGPALARLIGESPSPPYAAATPSFRAIEDEIARSRGWWALLGELPTLVRWVLAAAAMAVTIGIGVLLRRHNLAEYPPLRLAAELAALASVIVVSCWLWIRPLFKPQPGALVSRIMLASALALPLALAALPAALPASSASLGVGEQLHRAAGCFLFGSMIAMPALVLLVGVGRRSSGSLEFIMLPAVAAALAGLFALELHCPDAYPGHLLLGHAPIVWILPVLLLALRRLGRRKPVPSHR